MVQLCITALQSLALYNIHSIIRSYMNWHRGTDSKFIRWHLTSVGPVRNLLHVTLLADKIMRCLFDVMTQIFVNFLSSFLLLLSILLFHLSLLRRVTTLSYGSSFPLQSSSIPSSLCPPYANFSFLLSLDSLQPLLHLFFYLSLVAFILAVTVCFGINSYSKTLHSVPQCAQSKGDILHI